VEIESLHRAWEDGALAKVLTTKYNVAAARLSAQGDGPTAPVASNNPEKGCAKKRRGELVEQ
jgi:outer membrane protein OmpA-like peptidoglycan-associated protein